MKHLQTGEFHGQTNQTVDLNGIILTDTEYTHKRVDWHYHENAYFTFILEGNVIEGNRKEIYNCSAGSLLFHNWQEAHYNIKPEGFTRGFHIELKNAWVKNSTPLLVFQIKTLSIMNNPDQQTNLKLFHKKEVIFWMTSFSCTGLKSVRTKNGLKV